MKKFLVVIGMVFAGTAAAGQEMPTIAYCSSCSTAGFAWTAEQAAPPTDGIHPVYVLDVIAGEVRYFDVQVWWDCGGDNLRSPEVDPALRLLGSLLSSCTRQESERGDGDASVVSDMLNAYSVVSEVVSELYQFDSRDIRHAGDSAIDLIGPKGGREGLARRNLQAGVSRHLQGFSESIVFELSESAAKLAKRYIGSAGYLSPGRLITVHYPDGTSIRLKVDQINWFLDGNFEVGLETLTQSVRLPDGQPAPHLAIGFDGFEFTGDPNVVDLIVDVANRFDIHTTNTLFNGFTLRCARVDGGAITCDRE